MEIMSDKLKQWTWRFSVGGLATVVVVEFNVTMYYLFTLKDWIFEMRLREHVTKLSNTCLSFTAFVFCLESCVYYIIYKNKCCTPIWKAVTHHCISPLTYHLYWHLHLWFEDWNPLPPMVCWHLRAADENTTLTLIQTNLAKPSTSICPRWHWKKNTVGFLSYHLPNVREELISKVVRGFNGKLSRKIVNGAHENPVSFHTAGEKTKHNFYCYRLKHSSFVRHMSFRHILKNLVKLQYIIFKSFKS